MNENKKYRQYSVTVEITGKCINEDDCERFSCVTWYVTEKTYNEVLDLLLKKQKDNELLNEI